MDAVGAKKPVAINRWLPYWAVFQADVHQTLRSWVYRVWVFVTILAATGYLLYRLPDQSRQRHDTQRRQHKEEKRGHRHMGQVQHYGQ